MVVDLWNCAQGETNDGTAYVKDPAKTGAFDDTSIVKSLYPESETKTAPCSYSVSSSFPEKDGDGTTSDTCYGYREYEQPDQCLTRWINGRENAEFYDENSAYERQGIKASQKE